jgi:hypothetical protein
MFGKYRGKNVGFICRTDPQYIQWGIDNAVFHLSKCAQKCFDEAKEKRKPKDFKSHPLALLISQQQQKGIIMKKKVVLVVFEASIEKYLSDSAEFVSGTKKYSFFTDDEDIKIGDIYCADCERGLQFVTIVAVDGLTKSQIERADAWLISRVDIESHQFRLRKEAKAQEIRNMLDEGVRQMERISIYETMAKRNPAMGRLMRELHELDPEAIPREMIDSLPMISDSSTSEAEG